jgi:general secretion pathway protein G
LPILLGVDMQKNAFSMIEVVFVIVILGILAAVAIPKFSATRVDAQVSKGRSDVASIRSAIITERQSRLIKGSNNWITKLHGSATTYFDNNGSTENQLLMYGVSVENSDGNWYGQSTQDTCITYSYKLEGAANVFAYNPASSPATCGGVSVPAGGFVCISGDKCSDLTD